MLNPQLDRHPVSMKARVALAALLLAIAVPIAAATQAQSVLTGTVQDPSGKPLIDATVRLSSVNSDAVFETRTDGAGAFELSGVPAGDYMISGRAMGFSGQRQRIRVSGATTFALRLSVGTLRETITVTGGTGSGPGGTRTGSAVTKPDKPACSATAIGGQITPPMKIRDVRPRFKQSWTENNLTGEVLLQARIGLDGKVTSVEVVSGANSEMEDEAIVAVSQWEFTPTYLNCEPIEVRMFVSVSFKLDR